MSNGGRIMSVEEHLGAAGIVGLEPVRGVGPYRDQAHCDHGRSGDCFACADERVDARVTSLRRLQWLWAGVVGVAMWATWGSPAFDYLRATWSAWQAERHAHAPARAPRGFVDDVGGDYHGDVFVHGLSTITSTATIIRLLGKYDLSISDAGDLVATSPSGKKTTLAWDNPDSKCMGLVPCGGKP